MTDIAPSAEADPGASMMALAEALFPLCRSITGDGLRESLRLLAERIPLELHEVPSGTQAFDWTVPPEWTPRRAVIAKLDGRVVVDFARSNLHLVQYSVPVDRIVPLEELRRHLHTIPEHPDWIPYRTAYYAASWGFCVTQRQYEALTDPAYRVVIDAELAPGALTYGELVLPGEEAAEFLFSAHICHPSLANDNLSGVVVATELARWLAGRRRRLTYRFLFAPGTIGALAWLARNEAVVPRVAHGLVLTCLGDAGGFTYKRSRRGDAAIDRVAAHVLRHRDAPHAIESFTPYGYDERQYCSPGFDMPVGCLMRTPWGRFPEYHSSADDLRLVRPEHLAGSLALLKEIVAVAEAADDLYLSRNPKGEPQLGRRGLYRPVGGGGPEDGMSLLWVMNLADGRHSLLDMAERSGLPFARIGEAAAALEAAGLLERIS